MKTGVVLQRVLLGIINSNVDEWIGIANLFIVGTFSWVLCKGRGFKFLNFLRKWREWGFRFFP